MCFVTFHIFAAILHFKKYIHYIGSFLKMKENTNKLKVPCKANSSRLNHSTHYVNVCYGYCKDTPTEIEGIIQTHVERHCVMLY